MAKKTKKFLRRIWHKASKLGLGRRKKQVWRRPTGRDNKMREKRRGYPAVVSIGYRKDKNDRGKIKEKTPITIKNARDLDNIKKENIGIVGKIGMKKKIEIVKSAKEKGVKLHNINIEKFLKNLEKRKKGAEQKSKLKENKTEKQKVKED